MKQKNKKLEKKITQKSKRIEYLRGYNYRARASHAQGFSEKAEVENLFLDAVEEFKKGIQKKQSTNLASTAGQT